MAFQIPFRFPGTASDAPVAALSRPSKMMEYDQPLVWVTLLLMLFGLLLLYRRLLLRMMERHPPPAH